MTTQAMEDRSYTAYGAQQSGGSTHGTANSDDFEYRLYEATKAKYSQMLKEFEADDDLIEQTFSKVRVQVENRSIETVKPPTASDAVINAAEHVLTNPSITVPSRPVTSGMDEAGRIADRRAQFHTMWWDNVFYQCGDPLGRGKVQLVKGRLVLKKTLNWDALPEIPEHPTKADAQKFRRAVEKASRSNFLWNVQLIPKETVFEDTEHPWAPEYLFEAYQITVRSALKQFPELKERFNPNDPLADAEYVEYWELPDGKSEGQFVQWVDGIRVHEGPNPYCWEEEDGSYCGYIPYVIGDPGWGDTDAKSKPEKKYVSIIGRARSILEAEAEMLTTMREYMRFYVFKPLKTTNIPPGKELPNTPGAIWDLQEGQTADFAQPGDMPAGLMAGLARVNAYADQTSKFATLGGLPQRGVDTATEADQNTRNAATKLSGLVDTMRRMIIQFNAQVSMDIEHVIGVPVTLYGALGYGPSEVTLKPSDIDGFYMTHVELSTSDEAALNLSNARTWSDLAQRLPISFKTAMRMAGIMNSADEMDERTIENLQQSPPAMQALLSIVLQGLQANNPPPPPPPGTPAPTPVPMPNAPTPETIQQQQQAAALNSNPTLETR